jgi:hypothetical protein
MARTTDWKSLCIEADGGVLDQGNVNVYEFGSGNKRKVAGANAGSGYTLDGDGNVVVDEEGKPV